MFPRSPEKAYTRAGAGSGVTHRVRVFPVAYGVCALCCEGELGVV